MLYTGELLVRQYKIVRCW